MKRGSSSDNTSSFYRQVHHKDDQIDLYHGKPQSVTKTVVQSVDHRVTKLSERKKQIEQRNQKKGAAKKRSVEPIIDHKTKVDATVTELFDIFLNHEYVTKLQVTQWLKQSESVVGDALKQITTFHSTGEHKHHYSLKDEHKLNVKKAKVINDVQGLATEADVEFESE